MEIFGFFKEFSREDSLTGTNFHAILAVLVQLVQLSGGGAEMAMSMILTLCGGALLVGLLILLVSHLGK